MGVVNSLWRAIAAFRAGALVFAAYVAANTYTSYQRPAVGWGVLAGMAAWTGFTTWAYAAPQRRRWPLLIADVAATAAALGSGAVVIAASELSRGAPTLTVAWVGAPVLAVAVAKGPAFGAGAALVLGTVDAFLRGFATEVTLNGQVVLLLAGVVMGYLTRIAAATELRLQQATEREAAHRERERLARSIHDSVLQALALIERRGAALGGEAAELGRLAGEQGAVLRTLVEVGPAELPSTGEVDLRALLRGHASALVSVSGPATPVLVPAHVATEIEAAVAAALANVDEHAGTGGRAFVLVEDEGDTVTVTVRDDGAGMLPTRLEEAAAAGRLGVAQSIRGRIRDLSGTVTITSAPGAGTEVELRVPRRPALVREAA